MTLVIAVTAATLLLGTAEPCRHDGRYGFATRLVVLTGSSSHSARAIRHKW
jgi:hypothetical protein